MDEIRIIKKVFGILGGLFLVLYIGLPVSIAGQCNSKNEDRAIRQFIENYISEQHLNETYLSVSDQLANMFQAGFQTELKRQLSENEKEQLHYFWFITQLSGFIIKLFFHKPIHSRAVSALLSKKRM